MPPRRSARVAAATELATAVLSPLPLSVVLAICSLLPVDCRLRCLEVCRAWRALLSAERSVWSSLDVSPHTGGLSRPGTEALLRAAALRAGAGGLRVLNINRVEVNLNYLLRLLAANAGALRELFCGSGWTEMFEPDTLDRIARAAPQLQVLGAASLCSSLAEARRLLRREAPLGALQLRALWLQGAQLDTAALCEEVGRELRAHPSCRSLGLHDTPLGAPGVLDALVDAAAAARWRNLELHGCAVDPLGATGAPALARLLGAGCALAQLNVSNEHHMDAAPAAPPAAAQLAAALAANDTLTSLTLRHAGLWRDMSVADALLRAAAGHGRLLSLTISFNQAAAFAVGEDRRAAAGALLAALVAADSPTLVALDVSQCYLQDVGLAPLFDALPRNGHLRVLDCQENHASDVFFASAAVRRAGRANTALRALLLGGGEAAEALEEAVNARGDA
jgi:hypothetical protein